jgi:hypothetical protein
MDPHMISALIRRHEISWWTLNIAPADVVFRAIIAPPDIDPCNPRVENDYAFLVTTTKMPIKVDAVGVDHDLLRRVCLPERDDIELDNVKAIIVGWGEAYAGGGRSNELRWGQVTILSKRLCQIAQPDLDSNMTLCAIGESGACRGDSGGPLMVKDKSGRWVQVGIYSAYVGNGGRCGPNTLMLFNRIFSFWKWAFDTIDIDELVG